MLRSLYATLINPYFECCNIAGASNSIIQLEKLFIMQKKVLRVITGSIWNSHTSYLFKSNNNLKLFDFNTL